MERIDFKKRMGEIRKRASSKKTELIITKKGDPDLISLEKLLSIEFPESKWVIEKLIPDQGITIIAGSAGNFKTWLVLLMAKCIAKGENFLDKFPSSKSGVLIIDEENHLRLIKERLGLLGAIKDLPIYWLSQKGFLVEKDYWIKRILDICEEKKINVIFFDSLIRIHEADENTATTMSKVFKQLKKFCQAGKTVIITHHERKEGLYKSSGQNRLRGSSDISAAVDSHLTIRRIKEEKDKLIIEQPKLRLEQELEPFEVLISTNEERISLAYSGAYSSRSEKENRTKELILAILAENEEGLSIKETVEYIRNTEMIGEKSIKKVLNNLVRNGQILYRKGEKNEKICLLADPEKSDISK